MTVKQTGTRATCVTVDIEKWSKRLVPEQLKAQQVLIEVLEEACEHARLDRRLWARQSTGDGEVAVLPTGIDEATAIADLIREMATALKQANRFLNDTSRIRLRMAIGSGLTFQSEGGFAGQVVIECCRLLDSAPVRDALTDYPMADLALIVSEDLYREVIVHDFRDLRSSDFWQVKAEIEGKGFSKDAWVYVSDRTGGPQPPPPETTTPRSTPPPAPADPPEVLSDDEVTELLRSWRGADPAVRPSGPEEALAYADGVHATGDFREAAGRYSRILVDDPTQAGALTGLAESLIAGGGHAREALPLLDAVISRTDVRDDVRIRALYERSGALVILGDQRRAIADLEELIRLVPDLAEPPAPAALLRLGQCHLELGESKAAVLTWNYLLDHRPSAPEAYLRIGRVEYAEGSNDAARVYFNEGLRVLRATPSAANPDATARDLLLALSDIAKASGEEEEADRLLNQAASADPDDPAALITLAYRAAAREDRSAAYRLFTTAVARVPAARRRAFGVGELSRATALTGGDLMLELLYKEGCIEQAAYEQALAVRGRSRRDGE
jgi:tetratricopeptide (TPR) repeat protein